MNNLAVSDSICDAAMTLELMNTLINVILERLEKSEQTAETDTFYNLLNIVQNGVHGTMESLRELA